jgi:hypothetical protein
LVFKKNTNFTRKMLILTLPKSMPRNIFNTWWTCLRYVIGQQNHIISYVYFSSRHTNNAYYVSKLYSTALLCFPKNPTPWRESNPDLLFLGRMWCYTATPSGQIKTLCTYNIHRENNTVGKPIYVRNRHFIESISLEKNVLTKFLSVSTAKWRYCKRTNFPFKQNLFPMQLCYMYA